MAALGSYSGGIYEQVPSSLIVSFYRQLYGWSDLVSKLLVPSKELP